MPTNQGSFGVATGGQEALKNAMQKRGLDISVLDQVSAGAPGVQPPIPGTIPEGTPNLAPSIDQTLQAPQEAPAQTRSAEMDIALKALKGTVDTENKIAKASLGLR